MDILKQINESNDFEKVFELSPIILGISTLKDGRYVKVNKKFLESLKFKENDVIGKTSEELNIFVDINKRKEMVELLKKDGFAKDLELQIKTKDGEILTVLFSAEFLNNDLILASAKNITEIKKLREDSQKQKIFFEQMFMQSSTSTQILDKDGWCERINHKLSELFYVLPDDIEGKKYNIFKDEELKKKGILTYLEKAFNKGEAVDWEVFFDIGNAAESQHIKISEKKARWFYTKAYPLFDEKNQVTNVIIQHIDITERKKIEEELKNKEAQLSNALKVGLLGSWEYDFLTDVFTFSDSFYALLHTTVEKIGGYAMSSADYAKRFVYPEDAALVGAEIKKSIDTTDPNYVCRLEHRIIYAGGGVGHIKVLFSIIKDDQGRTVKSYGVNQDITERKKAEEELHNSKELLNRVINLLPIRVFWKDKNLMYLGCNSIFAKDAGKNNPDELIGKDDFQMGWKEQATLYQADDRAVLESGKSKINFEEPQTTPDGNKIWLVTSKMPLTDMNGKIMGILGTYDDITTRKKSEQELIKFAQESERFNKFAVDRELKMIDLKKEIKELQNKLKKLSEDKNA